jgi:hypothetical protein
MNTTNIDKLIADKSSTQAEGEWKNLILHLYDFFVHQPAGKCDGGPFSHNYARIISRAAGYFNDKNALEFDSFEKALTKFGMTWREERKCRLIEDKTKELLEKVSVI